MGQEVKDMTTVSWRTAYDEAVSHLCPAVRDVLRAVPIPYRESATEVRLLLGRPPVLLCGGNEIEQSGPAVTEEMLIESVISLTGYSVQAHQNELAQGFLSVAGGHRAGLAGTAVFGGGQTLQGIRDYNAIVLRIAHDGGETCAQTAKQLLSGGICGMLLAGIPGSGKTTLLKAISKELAVRGVRTVLIDERGEFSTLEGVCRLTGYPKAQGILMAVRALSPQVILCDELGGEEDTRAVLWALNCGVAVIGTAHADSVAQLRRRRGTQLLLSTGAFPRIAVLDAACPGTVMEVIDDDGDASARRSNPAPHWIDGGRRPDGQPMPTEDCGVGAGNSVSCDRAAEAALYDDTDRSASALCL
jgi:stage III sporulation protein AA